jgi:Flp pilus assembly protein TadD
MNSSQMLPDIKQLIGAGNVEPALAKLIEVLESDPRYAELAQIVRVNQADLYQNKAAMLKGTVSSEDTRLAMNQIADNALQVISRLEKGQFSVSGQDGQPAHPQRWRYYVAGGIVALAAAIVIWRLLGGGFTSASESCPNFGDTYKWKVMVLPFKQTGEKIINPELEISDGLNVLINQTPGMKSQIIADVNERYKIDENYPNPAEAADLARNCDAQMIVWGKINSSNSAGKKDYKLDVFYKLLDAGGVLLTGDTTLSHLLQIKEDGQVKLVEDVNAIVRLLYVVLANQSRMPIASNLLKDGGIPTMNTTNDGAPTDTAIALAMADNLVQNGEKEKAIAVYSNVLEAYPEHSEARQKRGALLYEKGDYAAASRDLDAAAPQIEKASHDILKIRVEAALKSGQPDKASDDLKYLKNAQTGDGTWLQTKRAEINDSLLVFRAARDKKEKMATSQPQSTKAQIDAGRANIAVGDSDRAIKNAEKALKINPKNVDAYEIKIVANAQKGDTAQVREELEQARREGINTKGIFNKLPPTVKLIFEEQKKIKQ